MEVSTVAGHLITTPTSVPHSTHGKTWKHVGRPALCTRPVHYLAPARAPCRSSRTPMRPERAVSFPASSRSANGRRMVTGCSGPVTGDASLDLLLEARRWSGPAAVTIRPSSNHLFRPAWQVFVDIRGSRERVDRRASGRERVE